MKEITIQTDRGDIYGRTAGEPGQPLVLGLHGWSRRNGWQTWEPLIEPLAAAGFHVLSIDMPGWGHSPAWEKIPGKSAVVALLDALGEDTYAIMGKSWGGGIALDFALTYPQRVQKLLLTAPAYRGMPAELERLIQPVLLAWAEDDPVIPISYGEAMVKVIPNCIFQRYVTGGHSAAPKNADDFTPKAVAFLREETS